MNPTALAEAPPSQPAVPAKADPVQSHVAVQWPHTSPLIACRFDRKGRFVFASAEDNSVQRWDLASGNNVGYAAHDSWVFAIAFSQDGETVITGGGDGRLIWWSTATDKPEPIRKLDAHRGWIRSTSVSPNGQWIASGGNDNVLRIWNVADGALVRELSGHPGNIYSLLFHPDGQFLMSGDLKGEVRQWEVNTGALVRTFDAKTLSSTNAAGQGVDFGGVRSLGISVDKQHLACGGTHNASNPLGAVHDPIVLLFDWNSQKLLQSHVAADLKGSVWRSVFHRDGYLIGANGGSSGGQLLFWKADQAKEFHRFGLPSILRDMDLHPDGMQIATSHHDRHVRITRMAAKSA